MKRPSYLLYPYRIPAYGILIIWMGWYSWGKKLQKNIFKRIQVDNRLVINTVTLIILYLNYYYINLLI